MSVSEDDTRKATGRVNAPLECWGWNNPHRYHEDRFQNYSNCPKKMEPDVVEHVNWSIQEYVQWNSAMGENRVSQGIQYGIGQTSSTTTRSLFSECRYQLSKSCNKEGFSYFYQAFIMCEMVDPYKSRSERVAYAAAIKKYDRENLKKGYEVQI